MDSNNPRTIADDLADVADSLCRCRVLVTGGSGFIGGRLIERLLTECGAYPRAIVRDHSRSACIARFGSGRVEFVSGSLGDCLALDAAVSGCSTVFHCAYDPVSAQTNLSGVQALIEACLKHNARLVHVSTFAIYVPLPDGDLVEDAAPVRAGLPYSENKLDVEECVINAIKTRGLDAVVVLPTIVYGPYGKAWTLGPAKQIAKGTVMLPENGEGLCNAVYVDDVCQALIRAAVVPAARGRRYLVSADTPITWRVFFEGYASALGRPGPKGQPRAVLERQNSNALKAVELLVRDPGRLFRPGPTRAFALWIPGKLGPILKRRMKYLYGLYRRVAPAPIYTPDAHQMAFYSAKCRVVIDRAKNELGYRPVYDFEKGMAMTGGWVRNALSSDS